MQFQRFSRVSFLSAAFLIVTAGYSQKLTQFYYNIMNPIMMDGEGYPGHSTGINILVGKFGFECEYAKSRKVHENRYTYLNPQLKFQFAKNEDDREKSSYYYITAGYQYFSAIKNSSFWGRSENLVPPYYDSTETALTYNDYQIVAKTTSHAIQFGYEKVTEKHISGTAFGKTPILNPFGMVIGWFVDLSDGSSYQLDYTRTFRMSVFAAPSNLLKLEALGYYQSGVSNPDPQTPKEPVVLEPMQQNLIGFRIGYLWTSLKPVGSTFGLEMTMVPGNFTMPGVYGRGFPDDNIFIRVNFGFAIGGSEKN